MSKPGVFKTIHDIDRTITPFKVYKSWSYLTTSSIDNNNIDRLAAIKPNKNIFSGFKVTLDSNQTIADSGSILINITNNKEASVIWYSINHLYYKKAGIPGETFGYTDHSKIRRTLFEEASVISIPQRYFGELIKPGSLNITLQNSAINSASYTLQDDGHGNLIDLDLSSSISNQILHIGFDSETYENVWTDDINNRLSDIELNELIRIDTDLNDFKSNSKNVIIFNQSLALSGSYHYGGSAYFHGNGYIRLYNRPEINFKKSEDFCISFWTSPLTNSSTTETYILSKKSTRISNTINKNIITTSNTDSFDTQYPYEIVYIPNTNAIICRQSNGSSISSVSSTITQNSINHIIFQKTGSLLELYVNGQFIQNAHAPIDGNIYNNADAFIGSLGIDTTNDNGRSGYFGSIDDFFIFNKALTQSEISQLSYTGSLNLMTTNTNIIGNVFYEHGIAVISDPRPKYGLKTSRLFNDRLYNYQTQVTQSSYLTTCSLQFNSTVTLYEHEYICKIKENEFNFTSNPTIRLDNDINSEVPKSFVYDNEFTPYITTVGLYNDNGELLAIGKLGTPIKKRDTVDLNIVVRFDI